MKITQAQIDDLVSRGAVIGPAAQLPSPLESPKTRGRGRRTPGEMNKLEARYAAHLEEMKQLGGVLMWTYEGVKLKLAAKTFYTPDFMVMTQDLSIEFHETKGFARDDAMVKIKVAARLFPFRFVMVRKSKQGWEYTEF